MRVAEALRRRGRPVSADQPPPGCHVHRIESVFLPVYLSAGLSWLYFLRLSLKLTTYIFTLFSLRLSPCKPSCDNLSAYSVPLDCYSWSRWEYIVFCLFEYIFTATGGCFSLLHTISCFVFVLCVFNPCLPCFIHTAL